MVLKTNGSFYARSGWQNSTISSSFTTTPKSPASSGSSSVQKPECLRDVEREWTECGHGMFAVLEAVPRPEHVFESYAVARSHSEEVAMAVVLVHQGPSFTQEKYEEVVRKVSDAKSRMDSPSDWPVAGLLVHAAGQGESGFRVVDVGESEDACNQFGEILAPILQEVGIDEQPELYQVHTFVSA
jgi:hypothetical protein